jgi:S-formylglutathione hydrolase FrmB
MAVIDCKFFSEVLGLNCSMTVILPQQTTAQIGLTGKARDVSDSHFRRHKTLWLLHGLSDDHTIWLRRTSIERYVAPLGLAVVMPMVYRSYYTDQQHGYRYGTFIREELPRIAREFFPLSSKREDNFIAGLSMGGYGALKLALLDPHKYAAAAFLSGALDPAQLAEQMPERRREFEDTFGPLDRIRGSDHDLFALAERVAYEGIDCPRLYQCCGTEDFLYEINQRFRGHAQRLKLSLTYEEGPGAHDWGYWDAMIQRVLAWLPRNGNGLA